MINDRQTGGARRSARSWTDIALGLTMICIGVVALCLAFVVGACSRALGDRPPRPALLPNYVSASSSEPRLVHVVVSVTASPPFESNAHPGYLIGARDARRNNPDSSADSRWQL